MSPAKSVSPEQAAIEARRKRASRILAVIAILFVLAPFLFWRGTWFGRRLSDAEMREYLADAQKPRHIQHALVQLAERIGRGDSGAKRWYPEAVKLAANPHPEIRATLAWVMGADNHSAEFHKALLALLQDPEPVVRRNAALSLVRFGDSSGKPEFLAMLRPFTLLCPRGGIVRYRLQEGDSVDSGTIVASIETDGSEPVDVRSPLPGSLRSLSAKDGGQVAIGEDIAVLSPGAEHVWEALRALYLVGEPEDLADIERFASSTAPDVTSNVRQQATLTVREIRRRAGRSE